MKAKLPALTFNLFLVLLLVVFVPEQTMAGESQNCNISETCNIGEFLYDDSYVPILNATCTLTSRYPDGTTFLSSVNAPVDSAGRYSYSATIGTVTGLYPTQMCCDSSGQHMCLDKTFKVVTPPTSGGGSSLTASDVWNYSDRSVTSFGSLVSDIWSHSSRSLTSFGDLVSGIWGHNDRQLTDQNGIAVTFITQNDIKEIQNVTTETRKTLEQIINRPVVKTFIDESIEAPNILSKLEKTKNVSTNIYALVQNLKSRTSQLTSKWPELTKEEALAELQSLEKILAEDDSNLIDLTDWLKKSWNNTTLLTLSEHAETAHAKLKNLIENLNLYGKQSSSITLTAFQTDINFLDTFTGSSLSSETDINLFGIVKNLTNHVALMEKHQQTATHLLSGLTGENLSATQTEIDSLETNILAVNHLPDPDNFLKAPSFLEGQTGNKITSIKNKILGLIALINTNKILLAKNTGETVNNVWLEEGSVVFRSVASNPSETLAQSVDVKFYLPTELKKEQIIKTDPGLKIDFDPIENSLFAYGRISLAPRQSKTLSVETEDIWLFLSEEIDLLKKQAEEMSQSLKKTSQYAQAVAIKSDVIVSLEKIMLRQKEVVTPENRIRAYRESNVEMVGATEKMNSLKGLTVAAGTQHGLFGIFGGVQAFTLWGIVIIIVAGFMFLGYYMRALRNELVVGAKAYATHLENAHLGRNYRHRHREVGNQAVKRIITILVVTSLAAGGGSLGTSILFKTIKKTPPAVLGTSKIIEEKLPREVSLKIPASGKIAIRMSPSTTSPEVNSIKSDQSVFIFKHFDGWVKIGLNQTDSAKDWWINDIHISK